MSGAPEHPLVSIVVPTYDRPEMLVEAVESCLAQTWPHIEVIVVDDAGTVSLPAFDDDRVRVVVHPTNRGGAAAVNTGVQAARGEWVTLLDDDDLMVPTRIADVLPSDADVVVSCAAFAGTPCDAQRLRRLAANPRETIWDTFTPSMSAAVVRRAAWLPIDETFRTCYDVDWWLAMVSNRSIAVVPAIGVVVRQHDGARHLSGDGARLADSLRLLDAHSGYFSRHRRARAFRWRRVAVYAGRTGDRRLAIAAVARSMAAVPTAGLVRHALPEILGRC